METKQYCVKLSYFHSKRVKQKILVYSTELAKQRKTSQEKNFFNNDSHSLKKKCTSQDSNKPDLSLPHLESLNKVFK